MRFRIRGGGSYIYIMYAGHLFWKSEPSNFFAHKSQPISSFLVDIPSKTIVVGDLFFDLPSTSLLDFAILR